jgi:hypothetical protein
VNLRTPIVRARFYLADRQNRRQVRRVESFLRGIPAGKADTGGPILFFNASTRINRPSLNAAFSLLASWSIRAGGTPVRYVVCQRGLDPCVLGTSRDDYTAAPPCRACLRLSRDLFPSGPMLPLSLDEPTASAADAELAGLGMAQLESWSFEGLPLGALCLPGLRWALRRHHLPDDEPTRGLFRRYLRSAASLARGLAKILEEQKPQTLVVFNGITYPEGVARELAIRRGIPVVTHEVGLRPFSAFFSHGHATFREVELPEGRELTNEENQRLDDYLSQRFAGRFTMAGIRFWPAMEELPAGLTERIGRYQQTVVVFTNVIFDTSQIHANVVFPDMFAWLDELREVAAAHPDTYFIFRAHPDENRPGKESRESVSAWAEERGIADLPNAAFYGPGDRLSSYELMRRAKLVLVYNSSIGLEASIAGAPVLCAGRARYTQLPTVFFPETQAEYRTKLLELLRAPAIEVPPEFPANARRFLDFELYHASLDLSYFLELYPYHPGMVRFREVEPEALCSSRELNQIRAGILSGAGFVVS